MTDNTPQFIKDLRTAAPAYFEELQKLAPTAVIDLFELRLTQAVNNVDETLYYHSGTNNLVGSIIFNGKTYPAVPVEMTGLETSGKGIIARPTLKVANANGAISSLIVQQDYNPLKAQVVRIRTFKKFIDAANFEIDNYLTNIDTWITMDIGSNVVPDPAAKTEEVWYIDRVAEENLSFVEFELVAKLDLTNLELPRRQVTEFCPWKYRGNECGYVAKRYFQIEDTEISKAEMQSLATINSLTFDQAVDKFDVCGKRVSSCRLRFPDNEGKNDVSIPFGGFLGSRVQA